MATQTRSVPYVRKGLAREGAIALGLGSLVGVPIGIATATVARLTVPCRTDGRAPRAAASGR